MPLVYSFYPLIFGTVTTSFPPVQTAVTLSGCVQGGSRNLHRSTLKEDRLSCWPATTTSLPSNLLITILVIPGRISIAWARTPPELKIFVWLHEATNRKNCVVSSIETSASEGKGSSSILAKTCGSLHSFFVFAFDVDETTTCCDRFFAKGFTVVSFLANMPWICLCYCFWELRGEFWK